MLPDHLAAELSEEIDRLIRRVNAGLTTLQLSQSKRQPEILSDLFRSAHTLKAVFITGGYDDRAILAHSFEELLESLRLGNREFDSATFMTLVDMARALDGQRPDGENAPATEMSRSELQKLRVDTRKSNDSLMDRLDLASEVRGAFTEFEDHRLAENLRQGRKVFEIKIELSAKAFDKELASFREQLSLIGEIVSVLPEPSPEKSVVDFRLFFASNESASSIKRRIKRKFEIEEVRSRDDDSGSVGSSGNRSLSNTFEILSIAAERMAESLGKQVEVRKHRGDIIVSSGLIETLREPMLHVVRNAVAHGIESPADRKKLRKATTGRITLFAELKKHNLIIEASDDGAGMDPKMVMKRAIELGYVKPDSRLPRAEQLDLIFLSGFSTTQNPDLSSGMGIGLDVVARSIEKLGGEISVKSRLGKGTTFKIKIPIADPSS